MRILLPTHAFTDSPQSGLHTVVWYTARGLAARGNSVHVITTWLALENETIASLRKQGIHVHHVAQFPMHNLTKPLALRCFLTALRLRLTQRFDWIYVVDPARTPFHRCKLGARLATRVLAPDTPEVRELLTTGDWGYDRRHKDEEEQWNYRRPLWYRFFSVLADAWFTLLPVHHNTDHADLVLCQGKETLKYWKTRVRCRTVELPNGVDAELFAQPFPPPRHTDRFVFLFVGRIAKRKGIFHLLEAFKTLRRERDDVELWIVGKGSEELTAEAQRYADEDPEHVFLFGVVQRKEVPAFFHACFALVDPMIYQGFSTVCLEALYCGKPVVTSRFGGTTDVVKDGKTGLLVDPRNEEELLLAMRRMLEEPQEAQTMARRGEEIVRSGFLWEHVTGIMDAAFHAP